MGQPRKGNVDHMDIRRGSGFGVAPVEGDRGIYLVVYSEPEGKGFYVAMKEDTIASLKAELDTCLADSVARKVSPTKGPPS